MTPTPQLNFPPAENYPNFPYAGRAAFEAARSIKSFIELTIHAVFDLRSLRQRSAESGMGTTSSCTPVSTFVSFRPCIATSAPILQFFAFNSSEEEMCQHVPFASVAMPPLFIALRVVLVDAIFAS